MTLLLSALLGIALTFECAPLSGNQFHSQKLADVAAVVEKNTAERVMSNGMRAIAVRTGLSPEVTVQVIFKIGASHEQAGERGLAHLLEHMIFKGTLNPDGSIHFSESDIAGITKRYGAYSNAYTGWDATGYYFTVNSSNWEPFLGVLAESMQHARFDDQHLNSELKAVVQELRMGRDNYSQMAAICGIGELVPKNHPYATHLIGYFEDLAGMTGERLKAFYDKNYDTTAAAVIVVGDVDPVVTLDKIEAVFGSIPPHENKPEEAFEPVIDQYPLSGIRRTFYRDVEREQLLIMARVPGSREFKDSVIAEGLSAILGGLPGNRLYQRLITTEKCAHAVEAGYAEESRVGYFIVSVTPCEGRGAECEKYVIEEIEKMMTFGATSDELQALKSAHVTSSLSFLQQTQRYSSYIARSFVNGRESDALARELELVDGLTSEMISDFAAKYLTPELFYISSIVPLPEKLLPSFKKSQEEAEAAFANLLSVRQRTTAVEPEVLAPLFPHPVEPQIAIPEPTLKTVLSNGAVIVALERTELPLISLSCSWRSNDLSFGRERIAADVASTLLTRRSDPAEQEALLKPITSVGAAVGFSLGGGGLVLTCAPSECEMLVPYIFSLLVQMPSDQALFESCRDQLVQALRGQKENILGMWRDAAKAELYGKDHPYGMTLDQSIACAESLTLADVQAVLRKYLVGNEMICSIVGALPAEKSEAICSAVLGSLPVRESGSDSMPTASSVSEVYAAHRADMPLLRDQMLIMFVAPQENPESLTERAAGLVAETICLNGPRSRLFHVREETGLFYVCWGFFLQQLAGNDYAKTLFALVNQENGVLFEEAVKNLIAQWRSEGVTGNEVAAAKQTIVKKYAGLTSSYLSLAQYFGHCEKEQRPFSFAVDMIAATRALQQGDVNAYLAKTLAEDNWTRVRIGNIPTE